MARRGFTIIEIMLVIGIIVALAVVGVLNLTGRRGQTEFDSTVRQISALLRDAQVRSVAQASDKGWGVHFENSTTTAPFYALLDRKSTRLNSSHMSISYAGF